MLKVQNVEWDKTPNIHNVESNKGRMGQNIEWDKMLNRKYVEWDKTLIEKMSNGTKCQIVYNVKYTVGHASLFQMFVITVVCC